MKTKLTVIGLVLVLGGWMAAGDNQQDKRHPRPRNLEQRVSDLERLVEAQSYQIAEQQAQIERFAPLAEVMEVYTWFDGSKGIRVFGSLQTDRWLTVAGNLYLLGNFIEN